MTENDKVVDIEHETISSVRVEGTPVRNRQGEDLGTIHSVMIEKRSGQVRHAILRLDSSLGTPGSVYPIPWAMLTYDPEKHGYVVDLDADALADAPVLSLDEADRPTTRAMDQRMFDFWGIAPVWEPAGDAATGARG